MKRLLTTKEALVNALKILGHSLEIPPEIPPDEESRWQATVKAALVESDRRAEASLDRVAPIEGID